jgi:small subunit ribosomal protein S3
MGQKVHPTGIRLGIVKDWTSTWYADTDNYADYLNMDLEIREFIKKRLSQASSSARRARISTGCARKYPRAWVSR